MKYRKHGKWKSHSRFYNQLSVPPHRIHIFSCFPFSAFTISWRLYSVSGSSHTQPSIRCADAPKCHTDCISSECVGVQLGDGLIHLWLDVCACVCVRAGWSLKPMHVVGLVFVILVYLASFFCCYTFAVYNFSSFGCDHKSHRSTCSPTYYCQLVCTPPVSFVRDCCEFNQSGFKLQL